MTANSCTLRVPVIQHDWKAIFREPWIRTGLTRLASIGRLANGLPAAMRSTMTYYQALAALLSLIGTRVTVMMTSMSGSPLAFIDGILANGVEHGFAHQPTSSQQVYFTVAAGDADADSGFYLMKRDFRSAKWVETPERALVLTTKAVEIYISA